MASRRRYKIGDNPLYDDAFDRYRVESVILNKRVRATDMHFGMKDLNNLHDLQQIRLEWTGKKGDGSYFRGSERVFGKIPDLERRIGENDKKYQILKGQKISQGLPEPDEPKLLYQERMALEAEVDVADEELVEIDRWIENLKPEKTSGHDDEFFKWDTSSKHFMHERKLEASAEFPYGILTRLYGQVVELDTSKNILVITDERSPYHGMSAADFSTLMKRWGKAYHRLHFWAPEKASSILFKRHGMIDKVKHQQLTKELQGKLMEENGWSELFQVSLGGGRPKLPAWPKDVKNFLKTEKAEESVK